MRQVKRLCIFGCLAHGVFAISSWGQHNVVGGGSTKTISFVAPQLLRRRLDPPWVQPESRKRASFPAQMSLDPIDAQLVEDDDDDDDDELIATRREAGSNEVERSIISDNTQDTKESADEAESSVASNPSQIPTSGISVEERMMEQLHRDYQSRLIPIQDYESLPLPGVARIVSSTIDRETGGWDNADGTEQPFRYIVSLSEPALSSKTGEEKAEDTKFVMIDLPPYSDHLVGEIRNFTAAGTLTHLLLTNRDSIHYDPPPGTFVTRRAELDRWLQVFPKMKIVTYRLDTPREWRPLITQRLDGYGPWAYDEVEDSFVETGRPLTWDQWDFDQQKRIVDEGEMPPEEEVPDDAHLYSPEATRAKEEGKRLLAVFSPCRTYGSMTYIFPQRQLCCSGYLLPAEDFSQTPGNQPSLESSQSYITAQAVDLGRRMEAARMVVSTYADRFDTILPSAGRTLTIDGDAGGRKAVLMQVLEQYERLGELYTQRGGDKSG